MKKLLVTLALILTIAAPVWAAPARENETDFGEVALLYIPNRVLDLLDIFSVTLGVGPVVEARLMFTRACDVGAGIGICYKAAKDYARQYGLSCEEFWYWSCIFVGEESYNVYDGTALMKKYREDRMGVPDLRTRTYDFFDGNRDYWAIGGSLGLGVDGNLYIHPVEWADLALGFFLIDIRNDDLILDDFR